MKYNVGDKVRIKSIDWYNENKDELGKINCGKWNFIKTMTAFCGKIMTISNVGYDYYKILEDYSECCWTDEMIEGFVEEECSQDFIEKYCKSCGTQRCDRTKEYLNGCPYYNAYRCKKQNNVMKDETKPEPKFKVGDKVILDPYPCIVTDVHWRDSLHGFVYTVRGDDFGMIVKEDELVFDERTIPNTNEIIQLIKNDWNNFKDRYDIPDDYHFVDKNGNEINISEIVLEKIVVPKFKKGDKIKDKNNRVWYVVHVGNRHFDISRIPNPSDGSEVTGYFVPMEDQDYYELVSNKELPKTYEECCEILDFCGDYFLTTYDADSMVKKEIYGILQQVNYLTRLLICRLAYWKIAGEEMGLGKPWEPDWNDEEQDKYGFHNEVKYTIINSAKFVFPTKEMRDAFKKNFDPDIEICKEFL